MKKLFGLALIVAAAAFVLTRAQPGGVDDLQWGMSESDVVGIRPGAVKSAQLTNTLVRDARWLDFSAREFYHFDDGELYAMQRIIVDGPDDLCGRASKWIDGSW